MANAFVLECTELFGGPPFARNQLTNDAPIARSVSVPLDTPRVSIQ